MVRPPISPETIHVAADGRFMYFDIDVTDRPFWWQCPDCGHSYQETLPVMTARGDRVTCPECKFDAGLCASSGCWERANGICVCDCGVHLHACPSHATESVAKSDHCGSPVSTSQAH